MWSLVLFIITISFVTGAIVTVYNHAIGRCNLFQKCNLFHHSSSQPIGFASNIILIRAKKVTRESYRLVEHFLQFYTLNIHISLLILHSHHANPYSLPRSCLCLLFHITLKNRMVSFSISAPSNLYPFVTSYSCLPSFIFITPVVVVRLSVHFHFNMGLSPRNS